MSAIDVIHFIGTPYHRETSCVLSHLGLNMMFRAEYAREVEYFREALPLARARGERYGVDLSHMLSNDGHCLRGTGRHSEAKAALDESLQLHRKYLGERRADVALDLNKLATLQEDSKDLVATSRLYLEAKSIFIEREEEDHWRVAMVLSNLGNMCLKVEDFAKAETWLRQAHEK